MDNLSALVPVNCSDLKASQSPSGNFRTAMSLLHMLNDVVVDNGKKIEFKKKSPTMTLTEGERNSYLDNILTIFEKYPNYRLIIRIKNSGSLGKARTINIYNYVFKNSKLKAQQIDIDRFKPRDEEVVWLAETDDIVISFDAN
jgi:hypothetical protein